MQCAKCDKDNPEKRILRGMRRQLELHCPHASSNKSRRAILRGMRTALRQLPSRSAKTIRLIRQIRVAADARA